MTAPSIVQTAVEDQDGSGYTFTASFAGANAAGDCILVFIGEDYNASATSVSGVTDSAGNSYTQVLASPPSGSPDACGATVYVCKSCAAYVAGNTVTVNWNSSDATPSYPEVYIVEVTGQNPTSPIDIATSATGDGTLASVGPESTAHANELAIGYMFTDSTAMSVGSGWTKDSNSITSYGSMLEYQTVASSGTGVTATTNCDNDYWIQVLITIAPPSSGGSTFSTDPPRVRGSVICC